MILLQLNINGLFGHFNHTVDFKDGQITIITAPNGYGKTVCLKVIDAIFNRRLSYLCDLQFDSISLRTSDGDLTIQKDLQSSPNTLSLSHSSEMFPHEYVRNYELSKIKNASIHGIDAHIPFLHRIGPREWEDHRTEEVYTYEEVIENFSEYLPDEYTTKNYPEWYKSFSDSLQAHFIQDQRLIQRKTVSKSRRRNFIDTIEKYADELSDLIRQSGLYSSHVSQRLDTTFPERLLRRNYNFQAMTVETLKTELSSLQKKRSDLSAFNLLSSEQFVALHVLDEIKEEDTKVLTLYVQDTHEKLSAYNDIYNKISLFSKILNNKRLSFKKIKIDADKGFHFETDESRPLKLTQLSSGEQHQVVLLYELIFKTEKNVLVLIDEPEISLHVAWQKEFLNDLKSIIKIQNMPVVIATHSPQIIDGNWDLTVDLEEGALI
ncbi:AAA family ATPase [Pseudomonas asiatica]|uniref:AAA family ATPase n=1 Tax=Pseudomonas asiatica TaxID=2219225 RepID=UPI0021F700EE|nr:AAA family ATPase [Pseudomonas asiatica]UYP81158.1 AAA family ATPase [Pseudomonas asiatica]